MKKLSVLAVITFSLLILTTHSFAQKQYRYSWVDNLRVRNKPGLKGKVLNKVGIGERVQYLGKKSSFKSKIKLRGKWFHERWVKIKTKKGIKGWVFGGALGEAIFKKFIPRKVKIEGVSEGLNLYKLRKGLYLGVTWIKKKTDKAKIYLIAKKGNKYNKYLCFEASNVKKYYIPSFFKSKAKNTPLLFVAEELTAMPEVCPYYDTARVYIIKNKKIKSTGEINERSVSILDYSIPNDSIVMKKGNTFILSFKRNLIYYNSKKKKSRTIQKDNIIYVIEKGKLIRYESK